MWTLSSRGCDRQSERERGELRHPQPQHCAGVGGIEHSLHFAAIEPSNQGLVGSFLREGTHLLGEVEATRDAVFQIAKEGLYGGQAGVRRADAVVAVLL